MRIISFIALMIASSALHAQHYKYSMVKGDTLWALAQKYLQDPYQWPSITYLDGSSVKYPKRMPIGTLLLIPTKNANPIAQEELVLGEPPNRTSTSIKNDTILKLINSFSVRQRSQLWNYYLQNKNGLVRAFYNGQEVVITVEILIEQMKFQQGKYNEK